MAQQSDLSRDLRQWWDRQSGYSTLKEFADRTGVPYSSLKKYFAGRQWPAEKNRALLFKDTQLEILRSDKTARGQQVPRPESPIRPLPRAGIISKKALKDLDRRLRFTSTALGKLTEGLVATLQSLTSLIHFLQYMQNSPESLVWSRQARVVQVLLDSLERVLRPFLDSPQGLQLLRSQVSGPDAGYISGLLAALFDDRRLANWRAMTTYPYGGTRHGR